MSRDRKFKTDMTARPARSAQKTKTDDTVAPEMNSAGRGEETTGTLIWVDALPLLRVEKAKLRATKEKLSAADERVRFHNQTDEPEYQRWLSATFAEQLGDIRALYEKLADLDSVVWQVEREILATGCSAAEAYDRVLQVIDEDSKTAKAEGESSSREASSEKHDDDSFGSRDSDSSDSNDERAERVKDEPWKASPKKSSKGDQVADDLIKQIYRSLVRKLHPDLNPDLSAEQRERWFEVQQAYDERDLPRLEMLLATCEGGDGTGEESFIDKIQSLSRLRLLLKSLAKKLKTSQRQLTQLKKAPAWDFHKTRKDPRRLSCLERDVKFELHNVEDSLSSDIRMLQGQIDRWSRPAPSRSGKRNKRDWNLSFEY